MTVKYCRLNKAVLLNKTENYNRNIQVLISEHLYKGSMAW